MATNASLSSIDLWRKETQSLILEIAHFVKYNSPNNQNNFYPHFLSDLNIRAQKLQYDDALHFCQCFPEWFVVRVDKSLICLNRGETIQFDTQCEEAKRTMQESKAGPSSTIANKTNIDDATKALLAKYNPLPPSMQCSVVRGEMQSIEPTKKGDCIHFKFAHQGKTRRFTFPREESDLVGSVRQRVHKITGAAKTFLYWNDEESLVVLECDDDMCAAIDFAERRNRPPCIVIEATVQEEGEKEPQIEEEKEELIAKPVIATREDSRVAFNDFAFMCDSCDAFLAPSNGGRYKCVVCENYDLCASCVAKGVHDNHALIRLMNGETIVPLSDGKGGITHVQVMDTPRCTPSFVVLQHYDKPVQLFDEKIKNEEVIKKRRDACEEERPKTTWEKVKETMEKQKASYDNLIKEREEEMKKEIGSNAVMVVAMHEEPGSLKTSQKTEEQKRREENLQNAIKNPFAAMRDEDRKAWKILKEGRELREKTFMRARLRREEEIEEMRRIDEEMKKLAVREEIIRLEMEQMKIEKALLELRMSQEKEPTVEEVKSKENQNQNEEHNELWSAYETWKEKKNEEKRKKENAEKSIANQAKHEELTVDETVQQKELMTFSSDASDLEIIDILAFESGTVLETMKVLEDKFDKLLLQPVSESAAPAADCLSIAVEDPTPPPHVPSPDCEMLEITAEKSDQSETAVDAVCQAPSDDSKLNKFQQYLLSELLETGIFDDYDRMVEVCRSASNLEQAIEWMLNDS